jgi:hypothetical protein
MRLSPAPSYHGDFVNHIADCKRTPRKLGSDEPIPVTLFGGDLAEVDACQAAGVDRVPSGCDPPPPRP